MATKEDILEQVVEEYLIHQGYFVQHNVKYKPSSDHPEFNSKTDSNHSDIDVLAIHPAKSGFERVLAVSCKSWQYGFNPSVGIQEFEGKKTRGGRPAWKAFRELLIPKWSAAFSDTIVRMTGSEEFTHVTAVTKIRGETGGWENYSKFRTNLPKASFKILSFETMMDEIRSQLTNTLAGTEVGRLLQLFSASGYLK